MLLDLRLHKACSSRNEDVLRDVSTLRFHGVLYKIDFFLFQFDKPLNSKRIHE